MTPQSDASDIVMCGKTQVDKLPVVEILMNFLQKILDFSFDLVLGNCQFLSGVTSDGYKLLILHVSGPHL